MVSDRCFGQPRIGWVVCTQENGVVESSMGRGLTVVVHGGDEKPVEGALCHVGEGTVQELLLHLWGTEKRTIVLEVSSACTFVLMLVVSGVTHPIVVHT